MVADDSIVHGCVGPSTVTDLAVIFPFINEFVESLGVTDNPDRIGWYSGSVESVFALVQFFTVYHWAKLSEYVPHKCRADGSRIGRKPVILIGLIGVAISGSLL